MWRAAVITTVLQMMNPRFREVERHGLSKLEKANNPTIARMYSLVSKSFVRAACKDVSSSPLEKEEMGRQKAHLTPRASGHFHDVTVRTKHPIVSVSSLLPCRSREGAVTGTKGTNVGIHSSLIQQTFSKCLLALGDVPSARDIKNE